VTGDAATAELELAAEHPPVPGDTHYRLSTFRFYYDLEADEESGVEILTGVINLDAAKFRDPISHPQLIASLARPGDYEIFACSCDVPACSGIFPVRVTTSRAS
jgi:hypothetical protein